MRENERPTAAMRMPPTSKGKGGGPHIPLLRLTRSTKAGIAFPSFLHCHSGERKARELTGYHKGGCKYKEGRSTFRSYILTP